MSYDAQLRSLLSSYANSGQSFTDCKNALQLFKDLRPHPKPFTFNDGSSKNLVCLEGTIPIQYKGNTYNIPIVVWLMETHPYNAPMVYVQPTSTMNIKPGRHVDNSGRVTVPYLVEWRQNSSDLTGLLHVLAIVFGEAPPVFAKSSKSASQLTTQPPYPAVSQPMPVAMPQPSLPARAHPYLPAPSGYTPSPGGYPPAPGSYPPVPGGYPPSSGNVQPITYPSPALGLGGTSSGYNSSYQAYGNEAPGYPSGGYGQGAGLHPYSYVAPTAAPVSSYPSHCAPVNSTEKETSKGYQLSNEEITRSLLSAVQDKMRWKLQEIFSAYKTEMDVLRKTQEDLQSGKDKLEYLARTMETEQNECEYSVKYLQEKITEMKESLEKLNDAQEPAPDEAIDTVAPLFKQLVQSFCEEQAIEDAIYLLGEALRRESLELDTYLKKVRDLSRRQFLLRALIQKCREKAGLSDVYG